MIIGMIRGAGCGIGEQVDHLGRAGVGGSDRDSTSAASRASVMGWRRYTRLTSARWCDASLQCRSPSGVTMSIATYLTSACSRSTATGYRTNKAAAPTT